MTTLSLHVYILCNQVHSLVEAGLSTLTQLQVGWPHALPLFHFCAAVRFAWKHLALQSVTQSVGLAGFGVPRIGVFEPLETL